MAKHFRRLNQQRETLTSVQKQLRSQQIDERDRLSRMIVGRSFSLPATEPINAELRKTPCPSLRYQHTGHIGLQYLRRSDVQRAIEAGTSTTALMQQAINRLGGLASQEVIVARQPLRIAEERPLNSNERRGKFWVVAHAYPFAQLASGREDETVYLPDEQLSLHDKLDIPQSYNVQLLWLGALVAPSIERAQYVLPLLEEQMPVEFTAGEVQFLPTARHIAQQRRGT